MQGFLDWLTSLPPVALYATLAAMAAIENIFPPAPSDTVVAFGSFLAARGAASLASAFLATWGGNVVGAMLVYAAGRYFGANKLDARLGGDEGKGKQRIAALYGKYGMLGLALSRFLPGIRALVPPVAGALRLSPVKVLLAFAIPSAIWYGAITVLAYRIGSDWDELSAAVVRGGKWTALAAAVVTLVAVGVWFARRKRPATQSS